MSEEETFGGRCRTPVCLSVYMCVCMSVCLSARGEMVRVIWRQKISRISAESKATVDEHGQPNFDASQGRSSHQMRVD